MKINVIGKISVEPTISVGPSEMNLEDIEGTRTKTAVKIPVNTGRSLPAADVVGALFMDKEVGVLATFSESLD